MNKTPIYKLKNSFISNNSIYIKRDDLIAFSFGGNKARKAVFFFEELEKNKCSCIVTYGSSSSNHCRIIANMAAKRGVQSYIISPKNNKKITFNRNLVELFGAKIVECDISKVKETIDDTLKVLREKGESPYFIGGGGHGDLGTKAYINAYDEVLRYEKEQNVEFDYIFHASGTGTTQAGLICGNVINKKEKTIVGISIARKNPYGGQVVLDSVNSYLSKIGINKLELKDINFIDDYILDGYGRYNKEIIETIKDIMMYEGIPLDTTYTGKAFWGMREYLEDQNVRDKNILFIHTGGTPLFFDDLEEVISE